MACACTQDGASRRPLFDQCEQSRAHQARIEPRKSFFCKNTMSHLSRSRWRQTIHTDVVLLAFDSQRLHQTDQRHLRCAVVGLAEVSVQT
jgi:hypothetical protein